MSPNPSTSETTIFVESDSNEQYNDEPNGWDMEVFDQNMMLKMKRTKLKGRDYRLNTSGWKRGVYIIRVNYNGEIRTEKLIVQE
ncbi:MAG: T9SS type A sorting domain-containing protein [Mangrovibacterium sp.]